MADFDGKVAWVTGSARGIGREIARRLAEAGATVVVHDILADAARETAEQLRADGLSAGAVTSDVADAAQVDATLQTILDDYEHIDILVNNAGVTRDGLIVRMKDEDWDLVLRVNLKGAFLCTKAVARPMMKQRSGRIVNVASVVGIMGNAGQANYSASKAGLIGLTKSAAREFASRGITVNAVAPGYIETEMTAKLPTAVRENFLQQTALGRPGTPADVAAAVHWLASDAAEYITGQVLHVDGGMLM
ncbi:MAG: 3-oxoacyl-[acyl-carrier-protein] reductase FabG [Calditrichaeota bacterium]|nr:3-oxoacyl-[acyl-carrier-protein] reductase FabG [Calditrichota bacterium]